MIDFDEISEFVCNYLGEIASNLKYLPEDRIRALEILGIISGIIPGEEAEWSS